MATGGTGERKATYRSMDFGVKRYVTMT